MRLVPPTASTIRCRGVSLLADNNINYKTNKTYFYNFLQNWPLRMAKAKASAPSNEKKPVAWKISTVLRHWLNSHAEYLSAIGEEISTDDMVAKWLSERLQIEEGSRSQARLEQALDRSKTEIRQK